MGRAGQLNFIERLRSLRNRVEHWLASWLEHTSDQSVSRGPHASPQEELSETISEEKVWEPGVEEEALKRLMFLARDENGAQGVALSHPQFGSLRSLYRYGFRLCRTLSDPAGPIDVVEFFSDGEVYRVHQVGSLEGTFSRPLLPGQCRSADARPVLAALGFAELADRRILTTANAILFGKNEREFWLMVDSRPPVFSKALAARIANILASSKPPSIQRPIERPNEQQETRSGL